MPEDSAYWERGRLFLDELVVSRDQKNKEIVRLLTEYVRGDWQAAIGFLLFEPTRTQCFMQLIHRNKKKRVLTELRKRLTERRKAQKRARKRERAHFTAAFAAKRDDSPIDR